MMKYLLILFLIINSLALVGCDDYRLMSSGAYIICYSGDKVIYEGKSMSDINEKNDAFGKPYAFFFRDADTGELISISGQCVIRHK